MNYVTDERGKPVSPQNPLQVRDVGSAHEREAISAETVTFITGAASHTGVVALDKAPVASLAGDKVGSYWKKPQNLVYSNKLRPTAKLASVTETATAAAVTIMDKTNNLEQLFEAQTAGTAKAVIRLIDRTGGVLYGWIGAISVSSGTYTISVYNTPAMATQSWVGTLSGFTYAEGTDFEIYWNESSFAWVTGTVLTEEIEYKDGVDEATQLLALSAGQYAINYQTGRIIYRKATTGTSDTCNYSVLKPYQTVTGVGTFTVDTELAAAAALADNAANPTTALLGACGMVWDGSAWDRMPGTSAAGVSVTEASAASIKTAVEIMDDWDETNRAAVNLIPSQVGITAAAGAVAANTPRVTLGSDDPAVTHLGTIAGDTTSIDGKITACNTGAVVVASGAITETNSGTISTNTGTIAGDTTSIDGKITACNTGAVVVASGAITETNRGTISTNTGTIAGDTTSIDGKITACNTGAVVVASGAITETNSGTIAGDTTSIDGKITACNTGAVVIASGACTVSATDLDIRNLVNASDSVAIYGSDDGGTTKRIIKTDAGGAIQVDLEVTNVGISGGQAADGAAVAGNPVRIGGKDGSGNTQDIITDTDGHVQVDVVASLPAGTAEIGVVKQYSAQSTIGHGVKTVATAGTDEALAGSTACKKVVIQAQTDNTGVIAVGASGVDATVATGTGVLLEAGDILELDIANLASVYIDATIDGDGVRFTYFN